MPSGEEKGVQLLSVRDAGEGRGTAGRKKMESNRWIATIASIWIQCSCGASYAFGIYSPILKSSQGYSQSTLDTVSVFKDIGANAGILSGLLYSAVVGRRRRNSSSYGGSGGPWVVHAAGAIQCFVGYFFMWLSVTGLIHRPAVPLMCLFMFMATHAQTFFNTANVVTAVQNFPDYGGTIIGIMKGCLGLSGSILIQMYQTLFNSKPSSFILMLALLPTLVSLLLMCLVRIYESNAGEDKKHLNSFSAFALITAAYLMIIIILENIVTLPLWARILTFVILLLLLASPLRIAIKAQIEGSQRLSHASFGERKPLMIDPEFIESEKFSATGNPIEYYDNAGQEKGSSSDRMLQDGVPIDYYEVPSDAGQEKSSSSDRMLQDGEDLNLLQAMTTVKFWLLFIAMLCGMGTGLATINNISQIGESLDYTTVGINTLVSLWSIWNFLGRFGAGYVSDILLHKRGWPRPFFMAITLATMTIGHLIIASGFTGNLFVGSVLVGVCYGSQWSLMPTITSEIFGVGHMGTIFNTIAIASPVGSYIFSVRVIGYIYDKEASGEGNSCFGKHCFMSSFLIMASVSLFGCLIAFTLFFCTKRFYQIVVLRRLQHSAISIISREGN